MTAGFKSSVAVAVTLSATAATLSATGASGLALRTTGAIGVSEPKHYEKLQTLAYPSRYNFDLYALESVQRGSSVEECYRAVLADDNCAKDYFAFFNPSVRICQCRSKNNNDQCRDVTTAPLSPTEDPDLPAGDYYWILPTTDACQAGHDSRPGSTSAERCMALTGCVYNYVFDDCASARPQSDTSCTDGHDGRPGDDSEHKCMAMGSGCLYTPHNDHCFNAPTNEDCRCNFSKGKQATPGAESEPMCVAMDGCQYHPASDSCDALPEASDS